MFPRVHLFESCPYSETEKEECLKEAYGLREEAGGQYTELVLPSFPLSKKIESLSWVAVGQSLLATYRCMSEGANPLVMLIYFPKSSSKLKLFFFCFFKENELPHRVGNASGK